jgi:hypothetical protein
MIMENEKTEFVDNGLYLHSEVVNDVMGNVPHGVFRVGTIIATCILVLLCIIGYAVQVPSYIEVPYTIFSNRIVVGIMSNNSGIVKFKYEQAYHVEEGDTIAIVIDRNRSIYYSTPTSGIMERNLAYAQGDYVSNGDTLARIALCERPQYKLILKIPSFIRPKVKNGTIIKIPTDGMNTYNSIGYIKQISAICDEANFYDATVEVPNCIIQNIPIAGTAKLQYKTECIFKIIFRGKSSIR